MPPASGLRLDSGIMSFDFSPSIGMLARDIDKLGLDIRSFREPLTRAIREVMVPSIRKNFDDGGRPEQWVPLSEVTIERGGSQPLVRSGTLRRTASQINIWDITSESATIRDLPERAWYGKIHQGGYGGAVGGRRGQRNLDARLRKAMASGQKVKLNAASIPARPFVLFQPEDEEAIERVFSDWLDERIARAGFNG
jgi:phage gpG-like protein